MRRKLFYVSAAMVFGVWMAGIDVLAAAGMVTAAFGYAAMLYVKPEYDVCKLKGLAVACAAAMLIGAVRMAYQCHVYDSWPVRAAAILRADQNHVIGSGSEASSDDDQNPDQQMFRGEVLKVSVKKGKKPKLVIRLMNSGIKCMLSFYGSSESIIGSDAEAENTDKKTERNDIEKNADENAGDLWRLTGSLIEFSGELDEPDTAGNPRCFDYKMYLRSQGICCVSSAASIKVVKKDASLTGVFKRRVLAFREEFIHSICNKGESDGSSKPGSSDQTDGGKSVNDDQVDGSKPDTDDQTEALLRGILFGDTDSMDEDMTEDFRRNGTAHILAVSALHIGLLYSIFRMLRKKAGFPGMTALFLAVLCIYGTMTLWTVSVTRAALLIVLMELGDRLDRPYDMLTSLGFVSMLVLIHEPYALYSTSFIMSYLAALSIGVILPALKRAVPDKLPESIKTSLAVQLGLVPYIAYSFNMIPVGSLLINIPVILLLTVIVTIAASAVPVYAAAETAAWIMRAAAGTSSWIMHTEMRSLPAVSYQMKDLLNPYSGVLDLVSRVLILINERFARIELLSPDVVSPPAFAIAAYYGILFLVCSESYKVARIRKNMSMVTIQAGITAIIVLISCVLSVSPFDKADIIMVDVGQGDCIHFRFRNSIIIGNGDNEAGSASGQTGAMNRSIRIPLPVRTDVIIDGGGNDNYNVGKKTLKPYLLKNGVRRVDLALATHLHTDHYKGIQELEEEKMVKQKVIYGKTGDTIWLSKVHSNRSDQDRIEIIWPDTRDPDTDDENKNSLIFKVYINGITVLVTGDLGEEGERALIQRYRDTGVLDCDVLKVCHHGSKYSSSAEFIEAVSPKVALIGVGKNNTYGHPSEDVIERFRERGITVYRTDVDGAIWLRRIRKRGVEGLQSSCYRKNDDV